MSRRCRRCHHPPLLPPKRNRSPSPAACACALSPYPCSPRACLTRSCPPLSPRVPWTVTVPPLSRDRLCAAAAYSPGPNAYSLTPSVGVQSTSRGRSAYRPPVSNARHRPFPSVPTPLLSPTSLPPSLPLLSHRSPTSPPLASPLKTNTACAHTGGKHVPATDLIPPTSIHPTPQPHCPLDAQQAVVGLP